MKSLRSPMWTYQSSIQMLIHFASAVWGTTLRRSLSIVSRRRVPVSMTSARSFGFFARCASGSCLMSACAAAQIGSAALEKVWSVM